MSQVFPQQKPADSVAWPGGATTVVKCLCGATVFDGQVIKSRVVDPIKGTAKCRCKRWVKVPIKLTV